MSASSVLRVLIFMASVAAMPSLALAQTVEDRNAGIGSRSLRIKSSQTSTRLARAR
jgi:hypothetical protein